MAGNAGNMNAGKMDLLRMRSIAAKSLRMHSIAGSYKIDTKDFRFGILIMIIAF